MAERGAYYWCLRHGEVERGETACRADQRRGPYATEAEARDWRDTHESREDAWAAEDERWKDEDEDDADDERWKDEGGSWV
jgi:hypothetical protein